MEPSIKLIYILLLIALVIYVIGYLNTKYEKFGSTSPGTYTQLYANDFGNSEPYYGYYNNIYPYSGRYGYYNPFGNMLWNMPTRTRSYYWPLYYRPTAFPWYYIYS